jgi:hypothetical protein
MMGLVAFEVPMGQTVHEFRDVIPFSHERDV